MISSFFGTPIIGVVIKSVEVADEGLVVVFDVVNADENVDENITIEGWEFVQTEGMTEAGIAVHKYGAYIIPKSAENTPLKVEVKYNGSTYNADIDTVEVGTAVSLNEVEDEGSGGGGVG